VVCLRAYPDTNRENLEAGYELKEFKNIRG
jgi:hypothetical protein